MHNEELIIDGLRNIEESLLHILQRAEWVQSAEDFLTSPVGVDVLDIAAIRLMAVGEEIKKIDRRSEGKLLAQYPNVEWKDIMGLRDFIAHAYFRIDAVVVFDTLKNNVCPLLLTIQQMIADLSTEN
ncbi:MAG: DUF86 domain-containing protein [Bacteroidales bacterium]|jgi:uncharacterized protein with HEPN domain|nr:DUF86 domain-containing protein [Bacteroidales bacterium]